MREAGPGLLSLLSHSSYITVTNACKEQDNTLDTEQGGGLQKREKRGEVTEGQRGVKKKEVGRGGGEGSMRHQLSAQQNREEMAFLHPVQEVWEGSVCGCVSTHVYFCGHSYTRT